GRNRGLSRNMIGDLDVLVKQLQIKPRHEGPDGADAMILRQHLVDRQSLHLDLIPLRPADTGGTRRVGSGHSSVIAPRRTTARASRIKFTTSPRDVNSAFHSTALLNRRREGCGTSWTGWGARSSTSHPRVD